MMIHYVQNATHGGYPSIFICYVTRNLQQIRIQISVSVPPFEAKGMKLDVGHVLPLGVARVLHIFYVALNKTIEI